MSKRIGYARVSSAKQENEGNSLEAQEKMLLDAGAQKVVPETFTGTTMDRPKLNEVLEELESGDTLLVTKLDRFARTANEGVTLIKELIARGVSVHVLNMGLINQSPSGKLMLTVMMAFAEYERDMIVERFNEGKAIERAKNPEYREGRKPKEIHDEFEGCRNYVAEGNMTVTEACEYLGISRSLWYKWMKNSCRA